MKNNFVIFLKNEFGINTSLTLAGFVKSLQMEKLLCIRNNQNDVTQLDYGS